ncbi:MAG: metal-dependent transcriptional regulator [Candidatus Bathyarchaeota archaeon]|nr:metal-dependent transcriptional regulator [Candidatus Bathyarchaeota archaeon]
MSTIEEVSPVIEEYLECIYKLEGKHGVARTRDIVNMLRVVPGTVTNTVKWLEKNKLITHQPYKGVKLTEKGRKIAIQVVRKHRLSERLLANILRIEWEKVHELACKLEHSLTEEMIKPLEKALKHPKTCPHGNPIPTKHGDIVEEKSLPLTNLNTGSRGVVTKVAEESRDILRFLRKIGIFPGALIEVLEKNPVDGSTMVIVGKNRHSLSHLMASIVHVKQVKNW